MIIQIDAVSGIIVPQGPLPSDAGKDPVMPGQLCDHRLLPERLLRSGLLLMTADIIPACILIQLKFSPLCVLHVAPAVQKYSPFFRPGCSAAGLKAQNVPV